MCAIQVIFKSESQVNSDGRNWLWI